MNTSSLHVPVETLTDLADGKLSSVARQDAVNHISTCSFCVSRLTRLRDVIGLMSSDQTVDAPAHVLASAIEIFTPKRKDDGAITALRRIVATLTFDSFSSKPAFGLRSGHAASRQVLYSAEDNDIDLRITLQNEKCVVAGQVMGTGDCIDAEVELSTPTESAVAALNDLCEFTFPGVPAGVYLLTVRMRDKEVEIPALEVKVVNS
jgi:hypothetical protein